METLDLNNKRKREKLTASEWNSLIDAINLLILRYNLGATIPTKLSQLTNDTGFITDISGKADKSDLARVATTGSYNDLKDKPDLSNIGSTGKSAYELAVDNGFVGNEQAWLASLHGQDGTNGTNGQDGTNGTNGTNGTDGITPHIDPTTGNWFIGNTDTGVHAQGPLGIQGETGALGSQGILGIQGPQGPTGTDGITPTVSVTNISGGHNVAFNYGSGDSRNANFNVMDGSLADLVQADWNQTDDTQADYIKNKPNTYNEIQNLFPEEHEFVEIGGVKWATMNIGASSIGDYGAYFLWGDTQGYTESLIGSAEGQKQFNLSGYKYYNGSSYTKYNYTDGKVKLDFVDDAAKLNFGIKWRMPTRNEWRSLINNTNKTWTSDYQNSGVQGFICTDKKDSSKVIFLPAGGSVTGTTIEYKTGSYLSGTYWTSETSGSGNAYYFNILIYVGDDTSNSFYMQPSDGSAGSGCFREYGLFIRPILDDNLFFSGEYNDIKNNPGIYTKEEINKKLTSANYEYVDLGLPSRTLWAKCNVGATVETDRGNSYMFGSGSRQYNSSEPTFYGNGESELLSPNDTATQVMGLAWHMPSEAQYNELLANTTHTYIANFNDSGVGGIKFTSQNGAYVFFPCKQNNTSYGDYWSSTFASFDGFGRIFCFSRSDPYMANALSTDGSMVRGVILECPFSNVAYTGNYNDLVNKPKILIKRIEIEDVSNNYDYVEIGGIKWATKNVGATNVTDEGLYFLWGDVVGHLSVGDHSIGNGWAQYKYGDGTTNPSSSGMLKYNSVDGMTTLHFSDDGAKHYMGGGWKIPSTKDFLTLKRNTTCLSVTNYQNSGVDGYLLTDKADNSKLLFFPNTWWYNADGSHGAYTDSANLWANELKENDITRAYGMYMSDDHDYINSSYDYRRGNFIPIRAILDEETMSAVAYTGDYNYLANKPIIPLMWRGTLSEYDALSSYDSNTIYIIT